MRNQTKIYFVLVAAVLVFRVNCWAQPASAGTKPAGTESARPAGAISGRVINSAGEPLFGASVSALALNGARSQAASVNSKGEFKIDGLEPGLYRLLTNIAGYVPLTPSPVPTEPVYYRPGDSVTLTMIKGAVITGTVTGPNGPLVGVGVFVTRVQDEEGKKITPPITLRERSTDDRGIFRFYGLPPGAYIVGAARPRVGVIVPSAYDNDAPTYFPSATRDTATEVTVRDGDEVTTDIQYRAEPGHAVSGKVVGVFESTVRFTPGASVNLVDLQSRTPLAGSTTSIDNHSFAIYGLPAGEYEIYAIQYPPSGEALRSAPQRISVRESDVTGLSFTLAPQASIEGRLVFETDPKASCAQRKETAGPETIVKAWRATPEKTDANNKTEPLTASISFPNTQTVSAGDIKGSFTLRNLQPGNYRIDSQPPASGWYLKSVAIGTRTGTVRTAGPNVARDGIAVKSGDRVTGLTVTIAEGASRLSGRISAAEGQSLPPRMRVYLVPGEREAVDNVFRFYEAPTGADQTFTIDHINPGRYLIVAHSLADKDGGPVKLIRRDSSFRTTISQEALAAKKEISFKPCERIVDYELPYSP